MLDDIVGWHVVSTEVLLVRPGTVNYEGACPIQIRRQDPHTGRGNLQPRRSDFGSTGLTDMNSVGDCAHRQSCTAAHLLFVALHLL